MKINVFKLTGFNLILIIAIIILAGTIIITYCLMLKPTIIKQDPLSSGITTSYADLTDNELKQLIYKKFDFVLEERQTVITPGSQNHQFNREIGRLQLALSELNSRDTKKMAWFSIFIALISFIFSIGFGVQNKLSSRKLEERKETLLADILKEIKGKNEDSNNI